MQKSTLRAFAGILVALGGLSAPALAAGPGIGDDFETGTLFSTDVPPGLWDLPLNDVAGNSFEVTGDAARSGNYGFRLTDTDVTPGLGPQNGIAAVTDPATGAYFLRTWFRITQSNDVGRIVIAQIFTNADGGLPLAEIGVEFPGGAIYLGGNDNSGNRYARDVPGTKLAPGTWYELEIEVSGAGSVNGSRHLRVNGTLVATRPGRNWAGATVDSVRIGEPKSDDRSFAGILDFDDVVAAPSPSGMVVISPSTATVSPGGSLTFSVVGGQPPYSFSMDAAPSGGSVTGAGLYTAGATAGVTDVVRVTDAFAAGSTAQVLVSPVQPDPDPVHPEGPPSPEEVDPLHLAVSCDCSSSSGGSALFVACLLGLTLARRRT